MNLFEINSEIERPDAELLAAFAGIPTANVSDAMANLSTMASGIRGLLPGAKVCGPACTVACRSGDFLAILQGVHAARSGDVLVIDNQGSSDTALFGEITATEARRKGIAGLVVDGFVRDIDGIRRLHFPVFARGTTPRVSGRSSLGEVNVPIHCGGTAVTPGDIVLGDSDGVVVVPLRKAVEVLSLARWIVNYEEELLAKVAAGACQADLLQLEEQFASLRRAHCVR